MVAFKAAQPTQSVYLSGLQEDPFKDTINPLFVWAPATRLEEASNYYGANKTI